MQTINQNVKSEAPPASAIAPSIMSYSQDICRVGASAAFSGQVIGLSGGKTIIDENCERLKLSKYLFDMGMKVAAISLLAQDERVFKAMWQAGTPAPYEGKIGAEAKELWIANPQKRPDKEDFEEEYVAEYKPEKGVILKTIIKVVSAPIHFLRSGVIGAFIGILPGAGSPIAAIVSYNEALRWSKDKSQYGKGDVRGCLLYTSPSPRD